MTVQTHRIADEPIIIATLTNPYDAPEDIPQMFDGIATLREEIENANYCVIVDARQLTVNFPQIVRTIAEIRQAVRKLPWSAKKAHLAMVGSGGLLQMAADAITQAPYGDWKMPRFPQLEQALDYAREKTAPK